MLLNVKIIIVDYRGFARRKQGERPPPPKKKKTGKFANNGEQPTNQPAAIARVNSKFC